MLEKLLKWSKVVKSAKERRTSVSDYVGSLLFPHSYQWERKKYVKFVFLGMLIIVIAACLAGWFVVHAANARTNHNPEPQLIFQAPAS